MRLRVREDFPFAVLMEGPFRIEMGDGAGLSAMLRRPATDRPVGVVVEIIPYRQHDNTIWWDHQFGQYLAGCGIAYLRVEVRGTGDSDGLLTDEYLPREQQDALAVIDWASRQPWCNGSVGMTGISWGGFASTRGARTRWRSASNRSRSGTIWCCSARRNSTWR